MGQKDVKDYLDKGMYGPPQLKPEEKKKYMGNFRERIFLTMTIKEMENLKNLDYLEKELTANPNQQLFINASVDFTIQNKYLLVAQKNNCSFTVMEVDTGKDLNDESIGLVYAGETAVNIDKISVTEKYGEDVENQQPLPPTREKEKKPSKKRFLKNIFK